MYFLIMVQIEKWGPLLKRMIRESGREQQDAARYIGMKPQNFSLKLKDDDVKIEIVLGVLRFLGRDIISVLYTPEEIKNYLPPYITPDDAAIIRELNEEIPEEKRAAIKRIFFDLLRVSR